MFLLINSHQKEKTPFYLYSENNIVENYNSFSNSFKKSKPLSMLFSES